MGRKITVSVPLNVADKGVTIDVDGATGTACKDLTRNLENALGAVVKEVTKPEFYEQETEREREREGGA